MPLFKSAGQLMDLGQDQLLRGDFAASRARFQEASKKFSEEGNAPMVQVAVAYSLLAGLGIHTPGPEDYSALAQGLAPLGTQDMKVGPTQVPAAVLAREAQILAESRTLLSAQARSPAEYADLARRYQALSLQYRQLGGQNLLLPDLFHQAPVSPITMAPFMAAMAEEAMGEAVVLEHPQEAAEHNQNARNWWTQANELGKAQEAAARAQLYGRTAKCWFCGREVTGEGVQFVTRPAEMGPWISAGPGAIGSTDPARGVLFACKGCASSIDTVADRFAQLRAKEVQDNLEAQIEQLRRQVHPLA